MESPIQTHLDIKEGSHQDDSHECSDQRADRDGKHKWQKDGDAEIILHFHAVEESIVWADACILVGKTVWEKTAVYKRIQILPFPAFVRSRIWNLES